MSRFTKYLRDTVGEMKHVKWPTTSQALVYSALVIGISALVALFISLFDHIFTSLLNFIV